uniref:Uncharacterized protein n=1 Tax=Anguilla anguilla TaxID=7936 RepID=A0A0E9QDS5_ANGAN
MTSLFVYSPPFQGYVYKVLSFPKGEIIVYKNALV